MNEVACVFRPVIDEVRARGIPPEKLLRGIPVALEELGNPRRRISWDDFTELARRCCELFGPDAFEELAARSAEAALPEPLRRLLGSMGSVRRAYWMGARFWGPRIFRATRAEFEFVSDGRLREVIEILPPYRESPEFFQGVRGLLRATPRLFGQPDAIVKLTCDGRRGEFLIEPPPRSTPRRLPLRTRLARRVRAARGLGRTGSGERLARALSRARAWHELPVVAVRLLQRELGVEGVALARSLDPDTHETIAETGVRAGRATSVRPLVFARRTVGWLMLWTPGGQPLAEEAERLLHGFRPLLSFLLESLLVGEANQRLMELLERNVSDWRRVESSLERIVSEADGERDPLLASTIPPFAGTVLLVEDDELLRLRGRRKLEAQGHSVVAVSSDLSDLPLAAPASGPIRLVVADLERVELGPESVQRIARLHPELRGVLLVPLRRP